MKTLLLLRHAKSSWAQPGLSDFERPLAPRGIKALPAMSRVIDALEFPPRRVYTSPAKRALQTAQRVVQKMNTQPPIEEYHNLYLAEIPIFLELTQSLSEELESVLFVAHNPGMEDFGEWLCFGEAMGKTSLRTANLACLELQILSWRETCPGCAQLRALIPSRLIKSLL